MAEVIINMKIMPDSPDENLKVIEEKAKILISNFGGEVGKIETKPIAFGLNALHLIFVMDESIGSTDSLENEISQISGISSVEIVDVRRTIG